MKGQVCANGGAIVWYMNQIWGLTVGRKQLIHE
jgi:hypothetical protein